MSAPSLNRIVGIVLLVAATGITWMVTWLYFAEQDPEDSPYWWKGLSYTGRVLNVSPGSIEIQTEGGPMTFAITPQSRVVLVGRVGLERGVRAQVKFLENKSGQRIARGIRVLREDTATRDGKQSP